MIGPTASSLHLALPWPLRPGEGVLAVSDRQIYGGTFIAVEAKQIGRVGKANQVGLNGRAEHEEEN